MKAGLEKAWSEIVSGKKAQVVQSALTTYTQQAQAKCEESVQIFVYPVLGALDRCL